MPSTNLHQWRPPGYNTSVEYSPPVMEELRLEVTDGFNRVPHGGVEIGGILFGVRDQETIRVLARREVTCEYRFGPSFTLSDNDRQALIDLLNAPNADPELAAMQPVGWYHSHTRSQIMLSEQDLEFYAQYFPEPWQIALVLRPHRFDPMRAGFFFREENGFIHAESTYLEFTVRPATGRLPAVSEEPAVEQAIATAVDATPVVPQVVREEPQVVPTPAPPHAIPPASGWMRLLWVAAACAAVLAIGLFWIAAPTRTPDVSLRAVDIKGQLRIDWDRGASTIRRSPGGALDIEDGTVRVHNELTREQLLAGNITYLRTSGDVVVRLVLRTENGSTVTELTRFLGAPVAAVVPATHASTSPIVPANPPTRETHPAPQPNSESEWVEPEVEQVPPPAPTRQWLGPAPVSAPRPLELPAPPVVTTASPEAVANILPHMATPVALKPVDRGPASGKIIWTGKLTRGGTIQILGNHSSQGHITGILPGTPVRVQVFPTELTQDGLKVFTADAKSIIAPEAPGAQNGWMQTTWVLNEKKAGDLRIVEEPGQANGWDRLTLKAERGDHAVIVLNWNRIGNAH